MMRKELNNNLIIRHETPKDYAAIAEVHSAAFTYSTANREAALVALLRSRRKFDAELSVVAEVDGVIVGHVLFTPYEVRVGGRTLHAAALSPLAILPDRQRSGIGRELMLEGHRRLAAKGFDFAFLLGHPDYYPKFGYRPHRFGACRSKWNRSALTHPYGEVTSRRVEAPDVPFLRAMWERWYGDADLAIMPEDTLMDWISPSDRVTAEVLCSEGRVLAYVRYDTTNAANIHCFAAVDREAALAALSWLNGRIGDEATELSLPIHPDSKALSELRFSVAFTPVIETWEAAMIHIVNASCDEIVRYDEEIAAKKRSAGNLIWPVEFHIFN